MSIPPPIPSARFLCLSIFPSRPYDPCPLAPTSSTPILWQVLPIQWRPGAPAIIWLHMARAKTWEGMVGGRLMHSGKRQRSVLCYLGVCFADGSAMSGKAWRSQERLTWTASPLVHVFQSLSQSFSALASAPIFGTLIPLACMKPVKDDAPSSSKVAFAA